MHYVSALTGEVVFEHALQFEPEAEVQGDGLVVVTDDSAGNAPSAERLESEREDSVQQLARDCRRVVDSIMDADVAAVPTVEHHRPDQLAVLLGAEAGIPFEVVHIDLLGNPHAEFLVPVAVVDEDHHTTPPFSINQSVDTHTVSLLVSMPRRTEAA